MGNPMIPVGNEVFPLGKATNPMGNASVSVGKILVLIKNPRFLRKTGQPMAWKGFPDVRILALVPTPA
jgi:hypothetical protein